MTIENLYKNGFSDTAAEPIIQDSKKHYKIVRWVERNIIESKQGRTSYALKEFAEKSLNEYISNGEFIAAMVEQGYTDYKIDGSNAIFKAQFIDSKGVTYIDITVHNGVSPLSFLADKDAIEQAEYILKVMSDCATKHDEQRCLGHYMTAYILQHPKGNIYFDDMQVQENAFLILQAKGLIKPIGVGAYRQKPVTVWGISNYDYSTGNYIIATWQLNPHTPQNS